MAPWQRPKQSVVRTGEPTTRTGGWEFNVNSGRNWQGKKALLHTYMLEQFSGVFLVVLQGEELGELLKDLILFWVMSKERS